MVQAGRLNLNTDVNHYLKTFKIPATYPEPITLFDLMNHTAGFEDRIIGTGAATAADVPPLGEYLATHANGGTSTLLDVETDFPNRFTPRSGTPDAVPAPQSTSPTTVGVPTAGFYESTRHNESTVEKLEVLTGPVRMTVDSGGTLRFQGKDWKPQGNGLYAATDGTNHLMFLAGKNGQHFVATDFSTFQLLPAEETLPFNLLVLLIFAATASAQPPCR